MYFPVDFFNLCFSFTHFYYTLLLFKCKEIKTVKESLTILKINPGVD